MKRHWLKRFRLFYIFQELINSKPLKQGDLILFLSMDKHIS